MFEQWMMVENSNSKKKYRKRHLLTYHMSAKIRQYESLNIVKGKYEKGREVVKDCPSVLEQLILIDKHSFRINTSQKEWYSD
jgi:hypothetical protein